MAHTRAFRARRGSFLRSTALLCAASLTGLSAASAQEPVAAADELEELEEVVVTGSRIKRRDLDAPNPVTIVGAVDIQRSGETDIANLLREIPALNGSLTATGSNNTGQGDDLTDDSGVGRLNLRNLGTNRTLVLVNGKRHVGGIQGDSSVDVSTIPIGLIERIETSTGGGSAVYGSDAVSGVVNFILKDDFEGLDYRGQFSISDEGDRETYFATVTAGTNFDDDRGNAVLSVEYTRETPIFARDRDDIVGTGLLTLVPNARDVPGAFGVPEEFDNTFVPDFRVNFSSADGIIRLFNPNNPDEVPFGTSPANIVFAAVAFGDSVPGILDGIPSLQVFNNGTLREFNRGIQATSFSVSGGDGITQNNPNQLITSDVERININGLLNYEIFDGLEFYTETKFVYTTAVDSDGVPFNDDIPIALDNPFIPTALRAQIDTAIAAGITPQLALSRDFIDDNVIPTSDSDRYTLRLVGGFRGDLDNGWNWDVSYNYGRTDVSTQVVNARIEDRFYAGVDAVVDPDSGNIVCRSSLDPSATPPVGAPGPDREGFVTFDPTDGSCAPINLFGQNSISDEAALFAWTNPLGLAAVDRTDIEQKVILATLAGDSAEYFELPAGPVGFAVGFEYREEDSLFNPNALETSRLLYQSTLNAVAGGYDISEFFGEVSIPVLRDVPFAQSLTIDGSFRHSDHSTAGTFETYGAGLTWQPIQDILLRGSYARAVRAPNIFELFSPPQLATIGLGADPCNPNNLSAGTEFRVQNCEALVGPDFNAEELATFFREGTTGGNPDLLPEVADTFTVGAVITPRFAPGLTVQVDYYNIEIEDAIDSLSGARIAELCVDLPTLDNEFCELAPRNELGLITDFRSGEVNLGAFETSGIDFSVNYFFDLEELVGSALGTLDTTVTGTHLIENVDFPEQNDPTPFPQEGQLTFPEWIVNLQTVWTYEDLSVAYQVRWQESQLPPGVANEDVDGNETFVFPQQTGDSFVHDITASYRLNQYASFSLTVNNLFDRDPFGGSFTRPVNPIGRTFIFGIQGSF